MPEKKTSGIIVPVPELSREARCALAFTLADRIARVDRSLAPGGEDGSEDPSDCEPMKILDARKTLLAEASKAVMRAISSALSVYRDAMREKYAPAQDEVPHQNPQNVVGRTNPPSERRVR